MYEEEIHFLGKLLLKQSETVLTINSIYYGSSANHCHWTGCSQCTEDETTVPV